MTQQAPIQEVFSSIQGEGMYVGRRQIFVRFAHCHLKCAYCDTPMTSADGQCHVEALPGDGKTESYANPVDCETLRSMILSLLSKARHQGISFTGGEPLLYHRFLAELLPSLAGRAQRYLETSGTQPEFLEPVLPHTDIIAMDIKLPSTTGEAAQFDNHAAFYRLARSASTVELFVKLVFSEKTSMEELMEIPRIVTDARTPIILQPVTALETGEAAIPASTLFRLESWLSERFEEVRVIPQTHKMLKVL